MLLAVAKSAGLAASPDVVWQTIRDPERVAACLPNLRDFRPADANGRYATTLVERLGPFSVQVPLSIEVDEDAAGRQMVARVSGEDRGGAARVRGSVRAGVRADGTGSVLEVAGDVEVLGRLASLGAVPMRRRADQVFEQFIVAIAAAVEGER
jgi:carbon monoxide dehydrogenase subunit G